MDYFLVKGGRKLSGEITVNTSKNAAVALLAASVLNRGRTVLEDVPQIEEVERWLEILRSIGMKIDRRGRRVKILSPARIDIEAIDRTAAVKTRSVILLLGALSGRLREFTIPQPGGCRLGERTIRPHLYALEDLGMDIAAAGKFYRAKVSRRRGAERVVLYESGDTVTENALLAAASSPAERVISFASANYMVEDLCLFLRRLGVEISSLGGADIKIKGLRSIKKNITYHLSEDPIEAMFFISLAVCTGSELTVKRCPIKFLRLELEKLRRMGLRFRLGSTYKAKNGHTDLVDIVIYPSRLTALPDKIHSLPFPGINIDNLPFFVPIAARAKGTTMIHDWVYENRAVYFSELNRLGAKITLLDPHRVLINGPVRFRGAEMVAPPALRPAAILLVAMLAASGQSVLRNVYPINRGYENLSERLREIGADIRYVKECSPSFKDAKNSPKSAN